MKSKSLGKTIKLSLITSRLLWLSFVIFIAAIFLINTFHESYPDEFDNILGGRYILQGRLPFTGFFTHHGPVAYYLAAAVELFSGISFVRFRLVYSFFLLALTFFGYYLVKRRFKDKVGFYPIYILIVALSATYFWGHMLLADNLAAFLLTPAYLLLLFSEIYERTLNLIDLAILGCLGFLTLFSTLTFTYLVAIFFAFAIFLYLRNNADQRSKRGIGLALLALAVPFLLYGGVLLVRGGMNEYIDQNLIFNAKYYIYNYPRPEGSGRINPLRFAIIIAHDFYNSFSGLLINSKNFNFTFPFNIGLALANTALLLFFLLNGQYLAASFLLLTLIYTNARSNPLTSGDRDYQSAVYIMISMVNVILVLSLFYRSLNEKIEPAKKIIYAFLFTLVGVYALFSFLFIFRKFSDKTYDKYMGKAPLIYDRPQLAPIMNKLVTDEDFMWIGPFEFEELFYANGRLPSKYHILIPGMGKSETIVQEMIADFRRHKPKVIMFDRRFFILGESPEMFAPEFIDFLKDEYTTLYDYRDGNIRYVSVAPINERVDLETKLFIDKERVNEVIRLLLKENLIRLL